MRPHGDNDRPVELRGKAAYLLPQARRTGIRVGFIGNLAAPRVSDLPHAAQAGAAGNRLVMPIAYIAGSPTPFRAAVTVAA